jgi:hypothetical protein
MYPWLAKRPTRNLEKQRARRLHLVLHHTPTPTRTPEAILITPSWTVRTPTCPTKHTQTARTLQVYSSLSKPKSKRSANDTKKCGTQGAFAKRPVIAKSKPVQPPLSIPNSFMILTHSSYLAGIPCVHGTNDVLSEQLHHGSLRNYISHAKPGCLDRGQDRTSGGR